MGDQPVKRRLVGRRLLFGWKAVDRSVGRLLISRNAVGRLVVGGSEGGRCVARRSVSCWSDGRQSELLVGRETFIDHCIELAALIFNNDLQHDPIAQNRYVSVCQ